MNLGNDYNVMSETEAKSETKITIVGEVVHTSSARGYTTFVVSDKSGEYENLVALDFKDDRIQYPPKEGDKVEMSGYVSSREWNGKYYTNVRGSFSKVLGGGSPASTPSSKGSDAVEDSPFEDDEAPF